VPKTLEKVDARLFRAFITPVRLALEVGAWEAVAKAEARLVRPVARDWLSPGPPIDPFTKWPGSQRAPFLFLTEGSMRARPGGSSLGSVYVFVGKKYDALKLLTWDVNGYGLYHKVIESDQKFYWPRLFEQEVVTLTAEQMNWLLDGYDVWAKPHRPAKFWHVS